jgi:flagellar biosynthesis/type III secretory pathway M-ring protein FliF/YscJ
LVRRAVGFNEERGDNLLVQAAQFARVDLSEPAAPTPPAWMRYLPYALAGLAALAVLTTVILVWRSSAKKARAARIANAVQATLGQAPEPVREIGRTPEPAQLGTEPTPPQLSAPNEEELRALAIEMARRDPATAAVVLKKWLAVEEAAAA